MTATTTTSTRPTSADHALHQTELYQYEDAEPTHGETMWWGWTCTCGDGGDGYGPTFAADLAYAHRERNTPCPCGNPTITTRSAFPAAVCELSCDCGFSKVERQTPGWASLQPWLNSIALTLTRHSCGTSTGPLGHSCHQSEPTYATAA